MVDRVRRRALLVLSLMPRRFRDPVRQMDFIHLVAALALALEGGATTTIITPVIHIITSPVWHLLDGMIPHPNETMLLPPHASIAATTTAAAPTGPPVKRCKSSFLATLVRPHLLLLWLLLEVVPALLVPVVVLVVLPLIIFMVDWRLLPPTLALAVRGGPHKGLLLPNGRESRIPARDGFQNGVCWTLRLLKEQPETRCSH